MITIAFLIILLCLSTLNLLNVNFTTLNFHNIIKEECDYFVKECELSSYKAPLQDTLFILNDVLDLDRYLGARPFADLSAEDVTLILEQGSKFVEDKIYPLNKVGDLHGCYLNQDHSVSTPPGYKEVYQEFCDGGWNNLSAPQEFGGQGLPTIIATALKNIAFQQTWLFQCILV